MTLLAARDLTVTPPGATAPAVRNVSLAVGPGSWLAVTGQNGGGKTSLMLALAGLWPSRGELLLDGRPFGPHAGPAARRDLAVVMQDPSSQMLQPTVRAEIGFGPSNAGLAEGEVRDRVERWGEAFGLSSDLGRDPARLSAGQQQKVLLAAALACEPRLLLADEPTAHLDREARLRALEIVRDRVASGMGVVWITQLDDELAFSDHVVELGPASLGTVGPGPLSPSGPELLHVEVAAPAPAEGPRVMVQEPWELRVPKRGIVGLSGPNGVGKSVVLAAISGLGTTSQIRVSWAAPAEPPPIAALQFPEQQIFEESPAAEVSYAAVARGVGRGPALDLAAAYLSRCQIDARELFGRRTWELSSGEKRILEVVATLVSPACLYLLDEPTAGLDSGRKETLAVLMREVAEHKPVLVASQDLEWLTRLTPVVFGLVSGPRVPRNPLR